MARPSSDRLDRRRAGHRRRVDDALERCLPDPREAPQRLHEAMRYAVLGGGKRVRATLVYAAAEAAGAGLEGTDPPACAVELIHAYSLVHDDLPAMDDDDFRRGRPSCHRAFDETTAILAGDALQTLAFEVLCSDVSPVVSAGRRCRMLEILSRASGSRGMAGGQAIDLASVGKALTLNELEQMHRCKTGALIQAAVQLGALCADADDTTMERLGAYGGCVGLAFQIQDDVLDIEGDAVTDDGGGGTDPTPDKPTYPSILGLAESRERISALHQCALGCLAGLGESADTLRLLSEYIVTRRY